MKLWIDDMRDAPDESWTEIRKVQPGIEFLNHYGDQVTEISIDHDIENRPDDETFMPLCYYITLMSAASRIAKDTYWKPKVNVHSDNPVGARKMVEIFGRGRLDAEWKPFTTNADFKAKYGLD